jgi:hypothetical protein
MSVNQKSPLEPAPSKAKGRFRGMNRKEAFETASFLGIILPINIFIFKKI